MTKQTLCFSGLLFTLLLTACGEPESATDAETPATDTMAAVTPDDPFAGTYVDAIQRNGYYQTLTIEPLGEDAYRVQITATEVQGRPGCNFADTLRREGDELTAQPLDDSPVALRIRRREAALEVYAEPFEERLRLNYFCAGGATLLGLYAPYAQLQANLPAGYAFPTEEQWLAPEYLADYNERVPEEGAITFQEDILTSGDFNGDGRRDYAALLLDTATQNVRLFALHGTAGGGYEPIVIEEFGTLGMADGPRYIGVGLDAQAPGPKTGFEQTEPANVANDAFILKVYEKTATLYYWDGQQYKVLQIAD